ncbi:MAG: hypothetical protein ACKO90_08960, partial [Microcystis panniformis]
CKVFRFIQQTLSRVCGKKFFVGSGVRIQESGFRSQEIILFILPSPQLLLCNNYWQPEIRWVHIMLCGFCQKNFFFAIKLHKKKIIVVGEID